MKLKKQQVEVIKKSIEIGDLKSFIPCTAMMIESLTSDWLEFNRIVMELKGIKGD